MKKTLQSRHLSAWGLRLGMIIFGISIFTFQSLAQLNSNIVMARTSDGKQNAQIERSISMHLENQPVQSVFKEIEKTTAYRFIYDKSVLVPIKLVTIDFEKGNIEQVLSYLAVHNDLEFKKINELIYVKKPDVELIKLNENRQKSVHGVVIDDLGAPLPGVTVLLKGTTTGTNTNLDGEYTLDVPDNDAVLVFSFIGFSPKEVAVGNQSKIDVTLSENIEDMDEVVVTALGITRDAAALAYAVTEVGGEDLTKARENNLGNALSGRIAGVNASGTSTGPGGSSRVIIRGNGSLAGDNQPLYVVNGMPIDNTQQGSAGTYGGLDRGDGLLSINPDDIETITVLKGGTAAALYGSRAANGVILITTKSGKTRKGLGVELSSTYTVESPMVLPDWQYEYGSGARGNAPTTQAEAIANGRISWGAKLDGSIVIQPDGESYPYSAQKNNIRNFYDQGQTFSNTLAISGGNDIANFRFSLSNMDNKGIVPNNTLNRKSFNLSLNSNLSDKIILSAKAQYNIEEAHNRPFTADFQKNPNSGAQLIATNIDVRTLDPGYDENGYETPWNDYVYSTNPYFAINKVKNNDIKTRFIGSFSGQYNFTEEFYFRTRFGIDQVDLESFEIEPTGIAFNNAGSVWQNRSTRMESNVEAILGFDKNFGRFSLNAIGGGNMMYRKGTGVNLNSGFLKVPFQYFIGNGSSQTFSQIYSESAINSVFGSVDVGFNNYLYLSLTGRQDWFSTLSTKNNSLFYPSLGLSFVLSDAWEMPAWMSLVKARASWAQVGGGAPNPYGINLIYTPQAVPYEGQTLMQVSGNTIPNANLRPYTSTTTEFGIDFRVFDRINFDLTVYDRTTTDDIVNASLPSSSGYTSVALNVGSIRNRGVELMLGSEIVRNTSGFGWDMNLNFAYNDNVVLKISDDLDRLLLPGATTRTLNGWIYHFEGQPFGTIAGYKELTDENGNVVYNSANGLPRTSDLTILGRGVPPVSLGWNNTFKYKNISLGLLLDGRFGASIYSATNAYASYYGLHKMTVDGNVRENGVTVSGVKDVPGGEPYEATVDAQVYYQGTAFNITDNFVQKADFIKLRQLTLGYYLPSKLLEKSLFESVNISFVGRNLWLIYNASDNIDPESNYSNGNAQGLENFGVPPARSYGFNIQLVF